MREPTRWEAIGAGVVVVLLLVGGARERQYARLEVAAADDVRVAAAAGHRADSIAAAFRRDTVVLTRRLTRTDTVIRQLVDTALLTHTDTVRVPVAVLQAIDTTIRACRETVRECAAGWAAERERSAGLAREAANLRKLIPSRTGLVFRCAVTAGSGAAGAGAIAGGRDGAMLAAGGAVLGCLLLRP